MSFWGVKSLTEPGLDEDEPKETSTDIIQVNFVGVVHTTRLAGYHFHRQPKEAFDRCLILVSSIMGYLDSTGSTLYGATKHAVRGMMCVVRRKGLLRVNVLAPWYVPRILTLSFASENDAVRGIDKPTGS